MDHKGFSVLCMLLRIEEPGFIGGASVRDRGHNQLISGVTDGIDAKLVTR